MVARAVAWPRTESGKISPTISQLMGPKLTCNSEFPVTSLAMPNQLDEYRYGKPCLLIDRACSSAKQQQPLILLLPPPALRQRRQYQQRWQSTSSCSSVVPYCRIHRHGIHERGHGSLEPYYRGVNILVFRLFAKHRHKRAQQMCFVRALPANC